MGSITLTFRERERERERERISVVGHHLGPGIPEGGEGRVVRNQRRKYNTVKKHAVKKKKMRIAYHFKTQIEDDYNFLIL